MSKNTTFRNGGFKPCIEATYTIDDMFEAFCAGNKDYDREGDEYDQNEFKFWLKDYYYDNKEDDNDNETNNFGEFLKSLKNQNKDE